MNLSTAKTDWSGLKTLLQRHNGIKREHRLARNYVDDVVAAAKAGKTPEEGLGQTKEALEAVSALLGKAGQDINGMAEGLEKLGPDFCNEYPGLADLCPFYALLEASLDPNGNVIEAYEKAVRFYRNLKEAEEKRRRESRMFNFDITGFEDAMALCGTGSREQNEAYEMAGELKRELSGKNPAGMERGAFIEAANGVIIDKVLNDPEKFQVFSRFGTLYGRFMDQLMVSRNMMEA